MANYAKGFGKSITDLCTGETAINISKWFGKNSETLSYGIYWSEKISAFYAIKQNNRSYKIDQGVDEFLKADRNGKIDIAADAFAWGIWNAVWGVTTDKFIKGLGITDDVLKGTSNAAIKGTRKWTNADGSIKWPPNSGFQGKPVTKTLKPGTVVDRYGGDTGKFVSPQGTPYANRSLPPGSDARPYSAYEVVKPIDVQSGKIAPWFDQPGGGTQYQFTQSIENLIQSGYLRRLP